MSKPTLNTISAALKGHYTPPKPGSSVFEDEALRAMLSTLPSLSTAEHNDPILVQIQKHHPGASIPPEDYVVIAFVDECIGKILLETDLDFKIEAFIRDLAPLVTLRALEQDVRSIMQPQPILGLINTLIQECIGWSEDLGILGQQYMEKIEVIITEFINGRTSLEECQASLDEFFSKEHPLYEKMEARLCDSELTVLGAQKGQYYSAELLNQHMTGKQLPLFIIFLLQGSWYEFLQQVFIHSGQKSKSWKTASDLTESLIWSLHPQKDKAKQLAVIDELPGKIARFTGQLEFDTSSVENCMADVIAEYEAIREGNPSPPCDFDLLEIDTTMVDGGQTIDPDIYKQVEQYEAGTWFLYDDKTESDEKVARIKLILNWRDTDRLLFTNQNRRKILHMSYHEFAGHISNDTIKMLNPKKGIIEHIKSHLTTVIQKVQAQKEKVTKVKEVKQQKSISREYLSARKQAMLEALAESKKRAKIKHKRAMILRQKAIKKLEIATQAVTSLNVDAWVKLPIMEGTLTPCKLVAIIPGADKYIFANRAGIKVADYTSGQLSHMIVTENSEILDTGAEFESVLESVVSGLREDRNKSYEELTGDNE